MEPNDFWVAFWWFRVQCSAVPCGEELALLEDQLADYDVIGIDEGQFVREYGEPFDLLTSNWQGKRMKASTCTLNDPHTVKLIS